MLSLPLDPERGACLLLRAYRAAGAPRARRAETAVHAAADAHAGQLQTVVHRAFQAGRGAYKEGGAGAAARAVRESLVAHLPDVLLRTLAAGGEAALGLLPRRRAAGDVEGHEFHGNQFTDHAAVAEGHRREAERLRREAAFAKGDKAKALNAKAAEHQFLAQQHQTAHFIKEGRLTPTTKLQKEAAKLLALAGPQVELRFDASDPVAAKWAREHAAELAEGISETTRRAIADAVAEQQESGEDSYDEILAAVGDEARAELIARTESMRAANEGQREAWDQAVDAGLLPDGARKVWIAAADPCPECDDLDGEEVALDDDYPGDGGDGPPLHPNCRCTEGIAGY